MLEAGRTVPPSASLPPRRDRRRELALSDTGDQESAEGMAGAVQQSRHLCAASRAAEGMPARRTEHSHQGRAVCDLCRPDRRRSLWRGELFRRRGHEAIARRKQPISMPDGSMPLFWAPITISIPGSTRRRRRRRAAQPACNRAHTIRHLICGFSASFTGKAHQERGTPQYNRPQPSPYVRLG